ncbi:DNA replication protein psf1 [Tulasnella sp. 403]|nr:DNA replication protein psf1 [Tulasnella sp. 403]
MPSLKKLLSSLPFVRRIARRNAIAVTDTSDSESEYSSELLYGNELMTDVFANLMGVEIIKSAPTSRSSVSDDILSTYPFEKFYHVEQPITNKVSVPVVIARTEFLDDPTLAAATKAERRQAAVIQHPDNGPIQFLPPAEAQPWMFRRPSKPVIYEVDSFDSEELPEDCATLSGDFGSTLTSATNSTDMFGDQALALIVEAKRSTQTDTLYKYNDEVVRAVQREIRMLQTDLTTTVEAAQANALTPSQPILCASTFYHMAIRRNKRCLLAYHAHRLERLKELYWASGGALPHILTDAEVRSKLSPHEVDFLREYNNMISDYRNDFLDVLDVAAGITTPPKDLRVVVEVVRECGAIQTESGSIDFKKGQRYQVLRSNVEHLIVQGYLEVV